MTIVVSISVKILVYTRYTPYIKSPVYGKRSWMICQAEVSSELLGLAQTAVDGGNVAATWLGVVNEQAIHDPGPGDAIHPPPPMVWVPPPPSLNLSKCQQSRGLGAPQGRDPRNCCRFLMPQSCHPCNRHHFWPLVLSSRLQSANSHRGRAPRRRDPCDCHHFWTFV